MIKSHFHYRFKDLFDKRNNVSQGRARYIKLFYAPAEFAVKLETDKSSLRSRAFKFH